MRPVLLALLFLLAACQRGEPEPPRSVSWRTTPRAESPGRVAVLPVSCAAGVGRSAQEVTALLAGALRGLGRHEVVLVEREAAADLALDEPLKANRLDTALLLRLRERVRADAVLLARIEQFQSYDPIALGMTAHLVACGDGEVLWSCTAHLDGARAEIQRDLEAWHGRSAGTAGVPLAGWKMALSSPSLFLRYASERMVGTIPVEPDRSIKLPFFH
jgi:hypothetical protein